MITGVGHPVGSLAAEPAASKLLNPDVEIPPSHDYAIVPVTKPPACLAKPMVDAGGHLRRRGASGVLGMYAEHEQLCELCPASRRALIPRGWDGVDISWIYHVLRAGR